MLKTFIHFINSRKRNFSIASQAEDSELTMLWRPGSSKAEADTKPSSKKISVTDLHASKIEASFTNNKKIISLSPCRRRSRSSNRSSHIASVAFRSTQDKHSVASPRGILSERPSRSSEENAREMRGMLPAPVPGVGRRQCYLNVIKGGHQSWGSTTRRPVGRGWRCPPFELSSPAQFL